MSLFLRKACQEHLDGVGLQNYHVQVDETSKCLQIVGECGDVLVSIAGIRLSRMAPAAAEIELAIELFDDFLAKHTGTFKEFIAAKARADKAVVPQKVSDLPEGKVTHFPYGNYWQLTFTLPGEIAPVVVKSDGKTTIPGISFNMLEDKHAVNRGISKVQAKAITEWVSACDKYNKAVEEKLALLTTLASCEI